jgi:TonB-dependent receptor
MILSYHFRKLLPLNLFLSLFIVQGSLAQGTGTIKGNIYDMTTGEGLPSANVLLEGTSIGAAADLDGKYILRSVPSGMQKITVSYVGYTPQTITIEVFENRTVEQDFTLTVTHVVGEEVVITTQAQGQREAINKQLTSNTITNVVSSEKIQELPDNDAATVLSRVPGVSLMSGSDNPTSTNVSDQVVIRGIQASMNLVMVNGIELPSTDINTRATDLGFISSNMLSGIEVVKVLTPDIDANAIGGVINLRLVEAPENFHLDVLSQGSLNQQDRTWDNYKFWLSMSDRFLDNKLGVFIQGNTDRLNDGNDQTTAAYLISQDRPYGEAPYLMNTFTFNDQQNIISGSGGSLILDYQLPHGSIMLQNTISKGLYNTATNNTQFDFTGNRIVYSLNRDQYDKLLLINALQMEYNFGNIKTELTLSHTYSNKNTDLRFGDPGDNTNFQNTTGSAPWGLDANGDPIDYSSARYTLTPDQVKKININPDNYKNAIIQDWAILRSQAFNEHIYNTKLDVTMPVSFSSDFSSEFKVGGKYTRTPRDNDLDEWYKRTGDDDFYALVREFIPGKYLTNTSPLLFADVQNTDYTRGQYYLDGTYDFKYAFDIDQISDFYNLARPGWGNPIHHAGSVQNDFNGTEIFSAGYLMGTFNIGPKLSLIAGVRYEHYNMDYNATMFYVTHAVDGIGKEIDTLNSVDRNDDHLFPGIQARYKFTDWCDLRLAYTQTVSRPDYRAILPNTFFTPGLTSIAGNPKLNPAISTNYDAYLSFYTNEIGLFTVGGFYKNIKDVFFQNNIYYQNIGYYNITFPDSAFWISQAITPPNPSQVVQTWTNNPYPAHIKGLEFEWQTNFWYLPQPFNSLVLSANYTRIWSDMDYQQIRNRSESYVDSITHRIKFNYITTDTIRTARLINQGNHIINIGLGIDYKGFSARIAFNMQGNVITVVGTRPETDQFTGNIYRWDFTIKQELPLKGLSVQLSGVNIFHNPTTTYQNFRRVDGGAIFDNELATIYSPRIFSLNLRYTL